MRAAVWTATVKPGRLPETIEAGRANVAGSRLEPGCERFDLYESTDGSDSFVTIEAFKDQAALDAHRETEHFKAFMQVLQANLVSVRMDWLDPPDNEHPVP
jgi:(4S)-4-hydroxy-5-phosphonooxypentane-2,3-dione isomerase